MVTLVPNILTPQLTALPTIPVVGSFFPQASQAFVPPELAVGALRTQAALQVPGQQIGRDLGYSVVQNPMLPMQTIINPGFATYGLPQAQIVSNPWQQFAITGQQYSPYHMGAERFAHLANPFSHQSLTCCLVPTAQGWVQTVAPVQAMYPVTSAIGTTPVNPVFCA
jgi:hypothetical protein